jgi:hypothetical protein
MVDSESAFACSEGIKRSILIAPRYFQHASDLTAELHARQQPESKSKDCIAELTDKKHNSPGQEKGE